ncbi:Rne/Rng family ribonuclease [Clostridium tyrobutyricum]|uniref:Rne/Rng family ribonuclease n=1 Tax=Clostridium tyrobutyricum TaxID=1519 RepID=UPI001C38EC18|nr:Rne/Rng family ribonuclease [Clostridium tyrobutyricum]MBV4419944.1 Rne/Rng family ribonuclease [Clostridium tyrobutyricum]
MKKIFIDRNEKFLRIAFREQDILKELFFQQNGQPYPGEVYKGIVKNIVPAIKSVFIDIGENKNVYMYLDNRLKNSKLKKGQEILVQVIKEDLGNKGARVSNCINIPGKYCVLNNTGKGIEFSKKIIDNEFKKNIIHNLRIPDGMGIMIRTLGHEVSLETIKIEFDSLYEIYKKIIIKNEYSLKQGLIFSGDGMIGKTLKDKLQDDNFMIYVDNEDDYEKIKVHLEQYNYNINNIEFYSGNRNIFDYYNIENEILSLRNKRVYLKCGGYIVIDKTEAMYVIDVNSGKNVKGSSMEHTVFITNLQAAQEIVTQIRLRNLSGIILIDFIDMDKQENKLQILELLRKGFFDDKNKTLVYQFTELNLVQIARKRFGRSIYDSIEEKCKCCRGSGSRIKFSYISMLIKSEIGRINEEGIIQNIHIEIGNTYKGDVEKSTQYFLNSIGSKHKNIYLTYSDTEYFKVEPLVFSNQIDEFKKFKLNK